MVRALYEALNIKAQIKWVNDIYISDKKVCGILTESSFDAKTNSLKYAFVGVGINVYNPSDNFPDDIKNIAGYIFSERKNIMCMFKNAISDCLRFYSINS